MEKMFADLIQYGALGIVAGVSLWHNFKIQDKLLNIIKENTEALTKLSVLIDKMEN